MAKFVLTAQLQLQAPNNVSQVVKQIQGQLQGIKVQVQAQSARTATRDIKKLTSATTEADSAAKKLGSSFQASVKRFSAIAIATRGVSLFTNTLANSIREAIAFERELIKISQVTGKSVQQLNFLTNAVTELSTSLGVSSTSLINVSRILSQAGLSANETKVALSTLAKTELAPTFDDLSETAEGAIAIFNQFRAGAAALEAQLGAINAVAGQFAVEAGDLISVVRRTGGVFKAAGGDLNELIALFTSVRSTTRESAESIATGLRTIFTRIQRPKTIEFLREYGIELLDLEGKFVGPYEAVRRLSAALQGLEAGDISFIKIAEELGGFRQIGKVIPLLQQFAVAENALEVAIGGANSLTEDQATAQAALAVQILKVQEQFAALVRNVTNTSTFQALAKTLLDLSSALIKIADALAPVIPLLTAFAAIKFAGNIGGGIGALFGGKKFAQGGRVLSQHRNVMKFARGGMVPGSGNRDTVPAMLTPGEFVIKKSSVAKLGSDNLAAMNENRYANGSSGRGVPKTAIKKGAQAGGVGIFDSDMIGAGAKGILTQIRSANKPYEVIHGPAGSGKTTFAAKRFGNNFVKSSADIDKYKRFVVLSGAGETKAGSLSPAASSLFTGASKITALAPSPEEVMSRRENRLATGAIDKRSEAALKGTLKAPTSFNKELYKQFSNVELLQKFKDGGGVKPVNITVDDGAIGGFFLNPEKGTDRDFPINVKNPGNITNANVIARELQGKAGGASIDEQLASLSGNARARVFGFKDASKREEVKSSGFNSRTGVRKPGGGGTITFKDLGDEGKERLLKEVNTASSSPSGGYPVESITGKGKGYLPGADIKQNAAVSSAIGLAAQKILTAGVVEASNKILSLANFGSIITPDKAALSGGADRLASDPNAKSSVEGFLYEGVIDAITGAKLAGGQAAFDFPYESINAHREALNDFFAPTQGIKNSLVNADAKRSVSLASSIGPKVLRDINAGNTKGYDIKQFATGGSVGSGTDTVPALLTPGEFVVNKKSAQKIGYGSLNRMNKVAKFAKGGVVGNKVQAFKDGGGVGASSGQVAIDVGPLNQALQSLGAQAFKATEVITQVISNLSNFGIAVNTTTEASVKSLMATGQLSTSVGKASIGVTQESTQRLKNIKASVKAEQQTMRTERALSLLEDSSKDLADEQDGGKQAKGTENATNSIMKFNAAMLGITTAISIFTPAITETSGYFDYLANNLSVFAMQVSTVTGILGNFTSISEIGGVIDRLGVKFGMLDAGATAAAKSQKVVQAANMAAAGSETLETGANVSSATSENVETAANLQSAASEGLSGFSTTVMGATAAVLAIAAGFYLALDAASQYAKKLKEQAIADGDVDTAMAKAEEEVNFDAKKVSATAGAVIGGAIGSIIPGLGTVIGASIGAVIGGGFAAAMTEAGDLTVNAARSRAKADALATIAANELAEGTKATDEALKEFQAGTASVFDVIAASEGAMVSALQARQAAESAQVAGLRKSTAYLNSWSAWFRDIMNAVTFGAFATSSDISKEETDADSKRLAEAKKAEAAAIEQSMKGQRILMKQVSASGGGFETFLDMLKENAPETYEALTQNNEAMEKARKSFENIQKEVERTKKAFEAMNLGMHGVNASASAATHALDNYLAAQEAGNIQLERSIATLEAGITSAAMGMDPAVFQDALGDAANTLASFGATEDQINKFTGNMAAINQAQVTFAKSSQDAKNKMMEDFKRGAKGANSLDEKRSVLANAVTMNLGPDVSDDVKKRIADAIEGGKLSDADMQKIMDGNFEPLSRVLGDLGEETLKQVLPALKAQAEAEKKFLALRQKVLQAEQAYIDARKKTIDVEMEAAAIKEEFGGPAVTTQQKESAIIRQANLDAEGLGVGRLQAADAGQIAQRNAAIQNELNGIAKIRNDAAQGDKGAEAKLTGESGINLANTEERLNKLAQQNYETTKKLIDLKRQELKVIQARNKAEKDAMKSLMAGDLESFLDKQMAISAGAAIAIGDTQGAQAFGSKAIGGAFANFEEMKQSGVNQYFGQNIGGEGGLLQQTGQAFGFSSDQAKVLAGSTQEEETIKAEARALADTLPQTAKIQENSAKQGLINAQLQYEAAKKQWEAAKDRTAKAMDSAKDSAPKEAVVTQTADTPTAPDKSDKPAPSPLSVGLARMMDAATGTTNAQDRLAQNTSYVSPSERQASELASSTPSQQQATPLEPTRAEAIPQTATATVVATASTPDAQATQESSTQPAFDAAIFGTLASSLDKTNLSLGVLSGALDRLSNQGFELKGVNVFDGSVNNFGQHINAFNNTVKSLSSLSLKVTVGTSNVVVSITEPAFLKELTSGLKNEILTEVQKKLDNLKFDSSGKPTSSTGLTT